LFARLLIPDLVLAVGMGAILTFVQLYFHLRFGLDPGPVGLIVGSGGIAAGIAALLTPAVARRWGNLSTAVRSQWATVPMMAIMAASTSLALAVPAYLLVIMLRGMSDPVYTAFIQERVPEAFRARLTGMYSVTYAIGTSLGPVASGQIQHVGGFGPAFAAGAACYGIGATLLFAFFRQRSSYQATTT
jgi:predicted MFS family arabinose efflux permease